jgi:hypothetical protein
MDLLSGEWVEVRSQEDILATLDKDGCYQGMPFMPEMLQHCGRKLRVWKRGEKACDVINKTGARRVRSAVHLEALRCDGSAHDNCQAGCMIFWKEAWLKRAGVAGDTRPAVSGEGCGEDDVRRATRAPDKPEFPGQQIYSCQATRMFSASEPMSPGDLLQYWRDWRCGNVRISMMFRAMLIAWWNILMRRLGRSTYPYLRGRVTGKTPAETLGLQPGEWVEVKSADEIMATIDTRQRNRGLWFDVEQLRFCDKRFRVLRRVDRLIDEKTGRMLKLPTDCIILDGVVCSGELSTKRLFCQRAIYPYWREIWLRRVGPQSTETSHDA